MTTYDYLLFEGCFFKKRLVIHNELNVIIVYFM